MSYIHPKTGGYVLTKGTAQADPRAGLANAVYLRLETPLGSYWADKALGSRLHELQREKDVPRVKVQAEQFTRQALAPLLTSQRVAAVDVETFQPHNGRLKLHAIITTLEGETVRFQHFVQVGG